MEPEHVAANIFNKHAQHYQDKYMDVHLYHDTLDLFCNLLPIKKATLFELACGPGNITKYLLQQRPELNILATDLAPKMLELAKKNNPTAHFQLLDCRDLSDITTQYDGLMCGFCLPYLNKEEAVQLLREASAILKPKGLLYLSTMEENDHYKSGAQTSSTGEDALYVHYHQANYLTQALLNSGFTILDVQRQDYPVADGEPMTDLIIIARSN